MTARISNSRSGRVLWPLLAVLTATMPALAQNRAACPQLEGQLAALDRGGGGDPGRQDQIRRYEEAATRQEAELDRATAQVRDANCEGGGFFLFQALSPQCGPLRDRVQRMRSNLDRVRADLAQLQGGGGPEREGQRRAILTALAQNDCGPQYRQAATQPRSGGGGFFEQLFGPSSTSTESSIIAPSELPQATGSFRTVCVRTCDGYYYPISFATNPSRFRDDERACQRSCPAAEVALYSHRNPGEDMRQAVGLNNQQPYTALPAAFRYRQAFDNTCSCRRSGETWAQALKDLDEPVTPGDIVVNEQRSRQMSQPRTDAQGRPIRAEPQRPPPRAPAAAVADPRTTNSTPATNSAPAATSDADPKRAVRSVGPTFYPVR